MNFLKHKFDGSLVQKESIDTSKDHLNIYHFDTCTLVYSHEKIGMVVSRKMTMHTDGLNHQGAFAAVFDAKTLKPLKEIGQTSGHSFANSLIANTDKENFMGTLE